MIPRSTARNYGTFCNSNMKNLTFNLANEKTISGPKIFSNRKLTHLISNCVISSDLLINIFSILICLLFWFGFWSFSDDRPNFGKKSKLENRFFIDRTITSDSLTNKHERDHKLFKIFAADSVTPASNLRKLHFLRWQVQFLPVFEFWSSFPYQHMYIHFRHKVPLIPNQKRNDDSLIFVYHFSFESVWVGLCGENVISPQLAPPRPREG